MRPAIRRRNDGQDANPDIPRTTRQLLLERNVGTYFVAKLSASTGIWIHNVVAAVLVYEASRSTLLVGAVSIAQFSPQVLLTPWAGGLADRRNRRKLVILGRLIAFTSSAVIGAWYLVGGEGAVLPQHIIGAALIVGIGYAISVPAMHALLPGLVRPNELANVVAIDAAPFTVGRAIGPSAGAWMLSTTSPGVAFLVVAGAQLALAVAVAVIRLRPTTQETRPDLATVSGLRYLRTDRTIMLLLLGVLAIGVASDPVITLTPAIADSFNGGPQMVATMVTAFGVGAAAAPLFIGLLRRFMSESNIGSLGIFLMAGCLVGLAVSPSHVAASTALAVGGMGMLWGVTSLSTQIQTRVPDQMRGRIMGIWVMCFVGSRPLAAAMNGALADFVSPRAALLSIATLVAGAAVGSRTAGQIPKRE